MERQLWISCIDDHMVLTSSHDLLDQPRPRENYIGNMLLTSAYRNESSDPVQSISDDAIRSSGFQYQQQSISDDGVGTHSGAIQYGPPPISDIWTHYGGSLLYGPPITDVGTHSSTTLPFGITNVGLFTWDQTTGSYYSHEIQYAERSTHYQYDNVMNDYEHHSPYPMQAIGRENHPSLYHHHHHHNETRGRGGRPSQARVNTRNSSNTLIPIHQLAPHQGHLFRNYLLEDEVLQLDDSSYYSLYIPANPNSDNFTDDNMSYEDRLELQERMGRVSTGLSEETIAKQLNTRTHISSANQNEEPEICVICQAEYEKNETIGRLGCGHEYHADCIKTWLLEKNVCPICKATPF